MTRQQQKEELILKLGLLLSPLVDCVEHPEQHDAASRVRARAKYHDGYPPFADRVSAFAKAEPGLNYVAESDDVMDALLTLCVRLQGNALHEAEPLAKCVRSCRDTVMAAISGIPGAGGSDIVEAASPFSTYCKIRDLCGSATARLVLVDRYMDASVFYRYLRDLSASPRISIVTWPESRRTNKAEFAALLDVSRLYAAERGPQAYRLVVHPDIHDRWLLCDGNMYSFGGSFKDAGLRQVCTLARVEPTPGNLANVDELLSTGTELFGPTQTTHP